MSYELPPIRLKEIILAIALVLGAIVFCSGALANADPLWFFPFFGETPQRIIVYRNGCRVELIAGQAGFDELSDAINRTLSQIDGYEQGYGLSLESLSEYREQERAVEVYFEKPIKIHVPYRFGEPTNLLIPLTGPFGKSRSLFGGRDGDYWGGALRLRTLEPLEGAAEQVKCES